MTKLTIPPNHTDSYKELKAQADFMASCYWRVKIDSNASWCILVFRGCDNQLVPSEWTHFKHCPECGKLLKTYEEGENTNAT